MCEMIARSCVCGKRTGICGGALCELFGSVFIQYSFFFFFISIIFFRFLFPPSFLVCLYGFYMI